MSAPARSRAKYVLPFLLACSAPGGPSAVAPPPDPTPTQPAAPDAAVPGDAPSIPDAAGSHTVTPVALSPECERPEIDLRKLFSGKACRVQEAGARAEIPPELVVTIEPPVIEVRRGKPARGHVRLENPTTRPLDVQLDYTCALSDQIATMIFDLDGRERVDSGDIRCGGGTGCGSTTLHLRLPAGGAARYPFEASTRLLEADARCNFYRGPKTVPAGRYQLRVRALFLRDVVTGEIVIR
jgi:hypothetical protein